MEAAEFKRKLKGSFEVRAVGVTWKVRCKTCGQECLLVQGKESPAALENLAEHARGHKSGG